jgi:hypothetical protein
MIIGPSSVPSYSRFWLSLVVKRRPYVSAYLANSGCRAGDESYHRRPVLTLIQPKEQASGSIIEAWNAKKAA